MPTELIDVLRWHVRTQLRPGPQQESELLFPSEVGGCRSPSALDKPFAAVTKAIELKKRITPRAMRRSFQDLCRTAEVKDVVAHSIEGLARVIRLMDRNPKPNPLPPQVGRVAPQVGRVAREQNEKGRKLGLFLEREKRFELSTSTLAR